VALATQFGSGLLKCREAQYDERVVDWSRGAGLVKSAERMLDISIAVVGNGPFLIARLASPNAPVEKSLWENLATGG
jgi:hypothetical protein